MPEIRYVGKKKKPAGYDALFDFQLDAFTQRAWTRLLKGCAWDDSQGAIDEIVIAALERQFVSDPDRFDVPILTECIDHFDGALSIPFETRTWAVLTDVGITSDLDLGVLISGTFREICDRLGDVRAAVDVSITSDSWLRETHNKSYAFQRPLVSSDLEETQLIARVRAFRSCGLDPTLSHYSPKFADVVPRNWSIAQARRWTLEQCGEVLNLTRERVRQIVKLQLFGPAQRRWTCSAEVAALAEECRARRDEPGDPELTSWMGNSRSEASALLFAYGYSDEYLRNVASLPTAVKEAGYRLHQMRRTAFMSSDRVGFVPEEVLREHLSEEFPGIDASLFESVLSSLITVNNLPHGYVYVEGTERSFFVNDVIRLLGLRGSLPFEEVYSAASRFYRVRVPAYVFPPRTVIREFFERDSRFWLEDETINLSDPVPHELTGVQLWVEERIREATGMVLHRATLWDRARQDGISSGTLNVYFSYSLYFKPIGRGCLTLTGHFPDDELTDIAVAKGAVIRVPTRLIDWKVDGRQVVAVLEVGTEVVDNGIFSPPVALRRLIQPSAFRVMVEGEQRGNVGWSGNLLYGLTTGLAAKGSTPGDRLALIFDVPGGELHIMDDAIEVTLED